MAFNAEINSLAALAQRMADESGNPQDFDTRSCLDHGLVSFVSGLGQRRPRYRPPRTTAVPRSCRSGPLAGSWRRSLRPLPRGWLPACCAPADSEGTGCSIH